ncbi:MAG: pyrroloquinoline quinone biosynthesis protein PqqE [Vulcanimicrobiaceae bacterium]
MIEVIAPPRSLLCELTYRCNLQCPYCYNPLNLGRPKDELSGDAWLSTIDQACDLGVVQIGFSGGEPTLRPNELVAMTKRATERGAYTNLITQGTFLDDPLLDRLLDAGLAHVQISIQAPEKELAATIAGTDVHERKLETLRRVAKRDVALTLNCVLHKLNHHQLPEVLAFAEREGIRRLELANVQFYGWAFANRAALMPSRAQVEDGARLVAEFRDRTRGRIDVTYVLPDYFEELPKPCMHGWGQLALTVTPDGRVLPCPAATSITTLHFPNVGETSVRDAWYESDAFTRYRGTAWMPEPCRSCDRKEEDWGGCRCQAFLLTGNGAATDPACAKSPDHHLVTAYRDAPPAEEAWIPRRPEPARV